MRSRDADSMRRGRGIDDCSTVNIGFT